MEILDGAELVSRIDFARPLHEAPEKESLWCIPFEWGSNVKGTRISIAKAKEIASELRAAVAEAEKRELMREFTREKARSDDLCRQLSASQLEVSVTKNDIRLLQVRLRKRAKRPK